MKTYDIYGVGNALVDQEVYISHAALELTGLTPGNMQLANEEDQQKLSMQLQAEIAAELMTSGGSGANTIFTAAAMGLNNFYACRVGTDALGEFYCQDLAAANVATHPNTVSAGKTGTCMVMVTPDGQRTMQTCLATSAKLTLAQMDVVSLEKSKILYIEGYLATNNDAVQAVKALKLVARKHGVQIAVTLSDPAMVQYARAGLDAILQGGVDWLFCNSAEAMAYTASPQLSAAMLKLQALANHVVVTDGANGAYVAATGVPTLHIPAVPVSNVHNTNGAGDAFAGAFMAAVLRDKGLQAAAQLAVQVCAEVIQAPGARLPLAAYQRYHLG